MLAALLLGFLFTGASNEPVRIDSDPQARQPQVAVGSDGRIVAVSYGAGNEVRCAVSTDGGLRFGEPVVVATLPKLALGMRRGPRVAITDDAIVVAAITGSSGDPEKARSEGDLLTWRSEDDGRSWSKPVRLNTTPDAAREGLHALAARPDGTLFCAWLDLRDGSMAIYGARSLDHGATWQPDFRVYRSPEKQVCTCCHPSVAFGPDGRLAVLWRNDLAGSRDMYISESHDNGETFGPAAKSGTRTWVLAQCPMDGGAIAFDDQGRARSVWMRAGQVYSALDENERRLETGVQPWAAAADDGLHVVWLARRPGRLRYAAPGAADPVDLAAAANDPVIAAGPSARGPVVSAWEAADSQGILTLLLRTRREP